MLVDVVRLKMHSYTPKIALTSAHKHHREKIRLGNRVTFIKYAQLQRLDKVLYNIVELVKDWAVNHNGVDQTARMHKLICAVEVCIQQK